MSNKKYHVIRVSGQVESSEWKGELEYGAPLYQDMKRIYPYTCTHHIYIQENAHHIRQPQRQMNPALKEMAK